jgi:two-component system, sensor histidine kinase
MIVSNNILVVEDSLINQKVIRWQLGRLGLPCVIVSSGAACLRTLNIRHYGLIFMDIFLPGLDGCETTKRIRQAGFTTPIIALTTADSEITVQKYLAAGMNGYLSKPADIEVLQNILDVWMPAWKERMVLKKA